MKRTNLDWSLEVDLTRRFIPESMSYLRFLSVYPELSHAEKLQFNQTLGLALCEQFIVLEDHLLVPIFQALLKRDSDLGMTQTLRDKIKEFIREEREHSEMFWRLLEKARPEWYVHRNLQISRYSVITNAALVLMKRQPRLFTCWIWLAMFLEERTLDISRRFAKDPEVDVLFALVHKRHMEEEMAHVSLDREFLKDMYAQSSQLSRRWNAQLFKIMLRRYTSPYYAPMFCLKELAKNSPLIRQNFSKLKREILSLEQNEIYKCEFFSRRAFPQSYLELESYPEMYGARAILPGSP